MSLRDRKQTYVNLAEMYRRMGKLSDKEASEITSMFRRCRSQEEQHQVFQVMTDAVNRLNEGSDRYAHLHRDDILEAD